MKIFGLFGPYFAIGLSGNRVYDTITQAGTNHTEQKIIWGAGSSSGYKRGDVGVTIGAGASIKHLGLALTYSLGLINIDGLTGGGLTGARSGVLGLTVAYRFGEKS